MKRPFILNVIYRTVGDGAEQWGAPDDAIEKVAGVGRDGSGTSTATDDRDLSFSYEDQQSLDRAVGRVRKRFPSMKVTSLNLESDTVLSRFKPKDWKTPDRASAH